MNTLTPGSIVVATDDSPSARRAVDWAARQAELEDRPLAIVTVTDPTDRGARGALAGAAAREARRRHPRVAIASEVVTGYPAAVLVELSHTAFLLVLGSRGHGPARSSLLGSVGAVVSSKAACPVVVCRPGTDRLVRWGITAGIDGDAHSPGVLRFAVRQAALRSRPLTVVHGQPVRAAAHSGAPAGRTPHARTSTALAELRELYPDVQITEQVHAGSVADALIDLADTSDLVVVGRPDVDDVPAPDRTLIATRVLDRVHTTVAVVPDASS